MGPGAEGHGPTITIARNRWPLAFVGSAVRRCAEGPRLAHRPVGAPHNPLAFRTPESLNLNATCFGAVGFPVRAFISLLLVGFLVACPELCRAEQLGCCADRCEESGAPDDDSQAPQPGQNDAVSCICAGAIRDQGSQIEAKAEVGHWLPLGPTPALALPSILPPTVRSGAPPGRDSRSSLRMHLFLRTLRC